MIGYDNETIFNFRFDIIASNGVIHAVDTVF